MTKKQFKHDFLQGLGSALLELQSGGNSEKFHEIVLYGCLNITSYDPQCEGDRGWYLHHAAAQIEKNGEIENAVIKKYIKIVADGSWLFEQLTSVLFYYAKDGSEKVSTALYEKYAYLLDFLSRKRRFEGLCHQDDMFRSLCITLLSLSGWSAFKRITEDTAERLLPKDADYFFNDWFYDSAKSKFGKKRVENYLHKQAEKSQFMQKYYEKAMAWNIHEHPKRPEITLEQVIVAVDGQEFHGRGLAMQFTRKASTEDLEKLAQAAIDESNINRKSELLWGFRCRAYPFPELLLLEWSKSEHESLRETAFYIMGHNPSLQFHDYAVSLIQNKIDILNGIYLLCKNYQAQNEELLFSTIKDLCNNSDIYDFHGAAMEAEEALASVRQKPKTDILAYLYQKTPCSCCRYRFVMLMHKKKILPKKILQECKYDSNGDIRAFAKKP